MPDNYDRSLSPYRHPVTGAGTYHLKEGHCGCGTRHGREFDQNQVVSSRGVIHLHYEDGTCPLTNPCKTTTPTRTEHDVSRSTSSIDSRLDELEVQLEKAKREKDFFENVPDEPVVDPDDPCFIFMHYESDNGRSTSWKYAVGANRGNRTIWSVCGPGGYCIDQDLSWERMVTKHFFAPNYQITISEAVGWEQLFTHPPINDPAETTE